MKAAIVADGSTATDPARSPAGTEVRAGHDVAGGTGLTGIGVRHGGRGVRVLGNYAATFADQYEFGMDVLMPIENGLPLR